MNSNPQQYSQFIQQRHPYHQMDRLGSNQQQNFEKKKQVRNLWSENEHNIFVKALEKYGTKNLKETSKCIGTRSVS